MADTDAEPGETSTDGRDDEDRHDEDGRDDEDRHDEDGRDDEDRHDEDGRDDEDRYGRDGRDGCENGDDTDTAAGLAAVVPKAESEAAIASLRAEGVYDESRSVVERDGERLAVPVTAPPEETDAEVVRADLPVRERGLADLLAARGWSGDELARAPSSWAVVGSAVLVDMDGVPRPSEVGEALLALHGEADTVLARGGISGRQREPDVEVVAGTGDTEVVHTEHGTRYALDLSRVMFSPGNKAERVRMGRVVEAGERVFDMFAGVGYFTLPMARAGARVTAAEINPVAFQYLLENAVLNDVQDRVRAFRADCRDVAFAGGDGSDGDAGAAPRVGRVVMGHYDAHAFLDAALAALSPGGVVHYHEATPTECLWDRPVERLEAATAERGRNVEVLERRRVKSYSEGVAHVVVDARVD